MVDEKGDGFQVKFSDIFADYQNPPLNGDVNMGNKAWRSWQHTPMDWWQCQLNFAVWCATAGCRDSADDHLQAKDPLASLYRFHVYYAARRLLVELKVALPGDQSHSWYQNAYDARAYKRLCTEFGVLPDTDWRQKLDHGCQGFGSWSTYMEPLGTYRHAHYSDGPFFHPMDAIRHNRDISGAWTMFIPDKSEGRPDTLEHSQGRDGVRRSKAVPGQRQRRHRPSTSPAGKIAAPAETDQKGAPSGRPAGPLTPAAVAPQQHGCDKPGRRKGGSHSRRGRGWPSGALVGVSLACPLRPREEVPPRR